MAWPPTEQIINISIYTCAFQSMTIENICSEKKSVKRVPQLKNSFTSQKKSSISNTSIHYKVKWLLSRLYFQCNYCWLIMTDLLTCKQV